MRVRMLALLAVLANCGGDDSGGPPVPNALRFTAITAGYYHTCGLASSGHAYCWGTNDFGTLGDGSRAGRTVPAAVAGGLTYTSIDAGAGQLGDGTSTDRSSLLPVSGPATP